MTKEELREVIEAVVASQTALMDVTMDVAFEKMMPFLAPGKLMPSLVFKVEAEEVRKLLRARANSLRSDAAEGESGMAAVMVSLDGAPDDVKESVKKQTFGRITNLRESADQLDWQASHLDERTYNLSLHDLEAILPTPRPAMPDYLIGRGQVRAAGFDYPGST